MFGWFQKRARSLSTDYTFGLYRNRHVRGNAELTATVQACVSMWERCLAQADVTGTDQITPEILGMVGRSLALQGESVWLMAEDRIIPCSDWDLSSLAARPNAYRITIPTVIGGESRTALADEIVHFRVGTDQKAPWQGVPPLKRASITADMLAALEAGLRKIYRDGPLGTSAIPMPSTRDDANAAIAAGFRGQQGEIALQESTRSSAAGGAMPATDWKPQSMTPNLSGSYAIESIEAARDAISMAFGIPPGFWHRAVQGNALRELERFFVQYTLQAIAATMAHELSDKLDADIRIDTLRPLQAFDAGGRARSFATLIKGLSEAREAGIDPNAALRLIAWESADG